MNSCRPSFTPWPLYLKGNSLGLSEFTFLIPSFVLSIMYHTFSSHASPEPRFLSNNSPVLRQKVQAEQRTKLKWIIWTIHILWRCEIRVQKDDDFSCRFVATVSVLSVGRCLRIQSHFLGGGGGKKASIMVFFGRFPNSNKIFKN
jgi:hypothetical protein